MSVTGKLSIGVVISELTGQLSYSIPVLFACVVGLGAAKAVPFCFVFGADFLCVCTIQHYSAFLMKMRSAERDPKYGNLNFSISEISLMQIGRVSHGYLDAACQESLK